MTVTDACSSFTIDVDSTNASVSYYYMNPEIVVDLNSFFTPEVTGCLISHFTCYSVAFSHDSMCNYENPDGETYLRFDSVAGTLAFYSEDMQDALFSPGVRSVDIMAVAGTYLDVTANVTITLTLNCVVTKADFIWNVLHES